MKVALRAGAALGVLLAAAGAAHAQGAGKAPGADDGTQLTEVVVTAEKRETTLQKTPLAVSAISGEALQKQGVTGIKDAIALIPSVQIQQANTGASFYIRGIGARGALDLPTSPVTVSYDGVVQQRNELTGVAMADIERVEVLRGPQGTLYGRNANAGAVNVLYRNPVLGEFSGGASLQVGNYDALRTEGVINLPLGDKVALRVVGGSNSHDGYLSNGLNDADEKFARAKLLIAASDDLRFILSAERQQAGGQGSGNVLLPTSSRSDPWTAPSYGSLYTIPAGAAVYCNPNCDADYSMKNTTLRGQADWDLSWARLTAILGHQDFERTYLQPFSGTWEKDTLPAKQDSAEIRLASQATSPISWVLGAFYLKYDGSGQFRINYTFDEVRSFDRNVSKTSAAFGQVIVPLNDRLRLTGGLRYTKDEVDALNSSGTQASYAAGGLTSAGAVTNSYSKMTWKAGAEFDLAAGSLVYGSVSTGIKGGGVNASGITYGPEEITAYEVGSKNRFLDNRLQVNAAAYYYDYTGYQLSYYYYVGLVPTFLTANVPGKTKVYGVELEGSYLLTGADRFDGSVSWQESSFGNASVATSCSGTTCTMTDLTGRPLPRTPRWTVTGAYEHRFDLASGAAITAHLDAQWKSSYFVDLLRFNNSLAKSYTLANARVTYDESDGKWSIGAYVNNIGNKAVLEQANTAGPVNVYGVIGNPRTYGLVLTAKF